MHPSLNAEFIPPAPLEPKQEMERNELCWCRSGKKWKKCHRDRHLQKEVPIGKILNDLLEEQKMGICLHPEASTMNCSNKIIKAHTVQRAGGLSQIAEKGHVISTKRGYENILRNKGEIKPYPVGTGKASTFMGFCSFHDNKLFEPIENKSFTLDHEAAFLLSFRAISYEYLTKQNAIKTVDVQREIDKGKYFERQVAVQQHLHIYRAGLIRGMQDLEAWKREYDQKFIDQDYLSMPHYAVEFDGVLPFVCSGGFHPEVDFHGQQLQIISRSEAPKEHVCVNVSVIGKKSFVAFGWHGIPNGPAEEFVRSFKAIDSEDKANACLIMAVEQSENTYFNPLWWNSLNESHKGHLVERMQSGIGVNSHRPTSTYLKLETIIPPLQVASEIGTL